MDTEFDPLGFDDDGEDNLEITAEFVMHMANLLCCLGVEEIKGADR